MGWFTREYYTPDGSPPETYDEYEFMPKEDITAYELALCLMLVGPDLTGYVEGVRRTLFHKNGTLDPDKQAWWELVKRHFKLLRKGIPDATGRR